MKIVLLGITSGYPHNISANIVKTEFISLGLISNGDVGCIVNSIAGEHNLKKMKYGVSIKGIEYVQFSSKFKYFGFLFNIINLFRVLKHKKKEGYEAVIIGFDIFPIFLIYSLVSKLIGLKRTILFHEWHIAFKHTHFLYKIDAEIKDRTFGYFVDGIFPISHFLNQKSLKFKKPTMKLPILADFNKKYPKLEIKEYFTYCGHATYYNAIKLMLKSFHASDIKKSVKLILVLHGNKVQIEKVSSMITFFNFQDTVEIKTNIPQKELYDTYSSSIGLIIPLDKDSIQDKARFSQKIAEYIATERPIITSDVGEISNYFENKKNAIIVPFTIDGYAEAFNYL